MTTELHVPPLGWAPRAHQEAIWEDMLNEVKNILVVGHRRFGKSELMLNDVGRRAAMTPANYFYMFPEQEHARRAMMKSINKATGQRRIDEAFPEGFRIGPVKEQEMVVEVRSAGGKKSVIQFLGSDNYDAVRGASPFGIYLDEWAECDPQALAILRPIVEENGGFFRFLTTPKGKNHVYKQFVSQQGKPNWGVHYLTAQQTAVFSPAQLATILQENIDLYGPELGRGLFEQEYLCTFETVTPGAYYLDLLLKLEQSGRMIGVLPMETEPVYAAFDLGWDDATAIWYFQSMRDGSVSLVGYDEMRKASIPDLIKVLKEKSWTYGAVLLPHDGAHHEITSGETTEQILTRNGFLCYVMPRTDEVSQIASVRLLLPRCTFHPAACERGIACLKSYHNKYKSDTDSWSPRAVHDWCLADGTEVMTPTGWQAVESLSVHDTVLTPSGPRAILRAGVVRWTNEWTNIHGILCTPEHRFFTERGLVEAGDVSSKDRLWTRDSWGLRCLALLSWGWSFGFTDAITLVTRGAYLADEGAYSFIGWSIRLCMARFRQAMTSIIETVIHTITIQTTWKQSCDSHTDLHINQPHDMTASVDAVARHSGITMRPLTPALPNAHDADMLPQSVRPVPTDNDPRQSSRTNLAQGSMPGAECVMQPAYNLTVEHDHCYFVRGNDGRAYLVANSSHGAKAFATLAYFAPTLRRGVKGGAQAQPLDAEDDRRHDLYAGKGTGWMR